MIFTSRSEKYKYRWSLEKGSYEGKVTSFAVEPIY